ncbi:MAG: hypothetical protein U0Z17_06640 [Bacteroidales bacterium]
MKNLDNPDDGTDKPEHGRNTGDNGQDYHVVFQFVHLKFPDNFNRIFYFLQRASESFYSFFN